MRICGIGNRTPAQLEAKRAELIAKREGKPEKPLTGSWVYSETTKQWYTPDALGAAARIMHELQDRRR